MSIEGTYVGDKLYSVLSLPKLVYLRAARVPCLVSVLQENRRVYCRLSLLRSK
jgi:hypothetical protein